MNKLNKLRSTLMTAAAAAVVFATAQMAHADPAAIRTFVHPGLLHTQADFDRMSAKVKAGAHPWIDGWNILLANNNSSLTRSTNETDTIVRGNFPGHGENYWRLMYDASAAYQTALRWKISGDDRYADKSVDILNRWASKLTAVTGGMDPNGCLALGLYGYQLANAAEIVRTYKGWSPEDFAKFQAFMLKVFYQGNHDFLTRHCGTTPTRFWANWDLCNMDSVMAIGVLCDRRDIYDEAVNYFKTGIGNGSIDHAVYFMHPGYLGQWQESGRDQGHTTLGVTLTGAFCEMAWHQGDDLYGYENNRVLAGMEYIAKYNLNHDVPFLPYTQPDTTTAVISDNGRGGTRPGWDLVYNHYVNIKGIAAPYTAEFAAKARPDGGGGNYGGNSGGFDQLGFTTLTTTLDPISEAAPPSGLTAQTHGNSVTLSWWGSLNAKNYIVRRAKTATGPYTTVATITGTTFQDTSVSTDGAYFYKVVALMPFNKQLISNIATASIAPKLIAEYKLTSSTGTSTADSTGNWAPASLFNGPSVKAQGGTALDGSNQYIQLPDGIVDGMTDFMVTCWVKLRKADRFARVFDLGDDTVSYMFFAPSGGDGNPQFTITCAGGGSEQTVKGNAPFPIDAWTLLAVTFLNGTVTLYINGTIVGSKADVLYVPADFGHSHRNYLGRSQYTDNWQAHANDPYLNGSIADFRIYTGALSPLEVRSLAQKAPVN